MNTRRPNSTTRGRGSSSTATGKVCIQRQLKRDSGDVIIENILALAEYEIQHDPYRGIVNFDVPSPWFQCRHTEDDSDCGKVSQVCGCACPSLLSWTRQYDALKKRKKRKRAESDDDVPHLGRRSQDPTFHCHCDHNPFCLASLGGAMDDFLAEAAMETLQSEPAMEALQPNLNNVLPNNDNIDDTSDCSGMTEVIDVDKREADLVIDVDKNEADILTRGEPVLEVHDEVEVVCWKSAPETSCAVAIINGNTTKSSPVDKSKTTAEAFLQDVAFSADELDHTNENCIYSKITKEQLSAIRKEAHLAIDPIRSYADNIVLIHADTTFTQNAYFDRLQTLHDRLLFPNPLKVNKPTVDGKMRFAVPPGMNNLGATCYLNTQLQCLARNTAFLDGIFAWRPSKTASRMDSVLSTLQQIMARLANGAGATSTTEEFSQALGLQNDEMQDPNEFARLLFQRMHEAFQQCSQVGTNGAQSLATLLPTLFEGDMTYETQCQSCERVTQRSEKFMDINLPIVHSGATPTKFSGGQLQIQEAFIAGKKDKETSVQYCLDTYMCSEGLTGDNQYWCESCQTKRDATRQVVFGKLPPVLNLQLCRYVYDRKKQTKKKLTDRVLLPQRLNVDSKEDSESTVYRLCAVMKHLGNSAYQGHYIAEAMDWQTGTWFEFNDDKVSILESGPSCSPNDPPNEKNSKKKGSQDAYNMYYVRESFLGRCAMGSVVDERKREEDTTIKQLECERQARYDMLSDMCRNDARVAEQVKRRKRGLMTLLRRSFQSESCRVDFGTSTQEEMSKAAIWVDGAVLRSIFACSSQEGEDLLQMILREDVICEHKVGLEPRIARCGKLVPKEFYDELLLLLRTEHGFLQKSIHPVSGTQVSLSADCVTSSRISCDQCAQSYKFALQEKMGLVRSLQVLYRDLDPKNEGVVGEAANDEYIYAVSKRFVTKLRKSIAASLKNLESFDAISGGLDSLEAFSSLPKWHSSSVDNEIDVTVNSAIICENGKCCPVNKRNVRYVSDRLWTLIRHFFPLAIPLKKLQSEEQVWIRCTECEGSNKERESLEDWAILVTSGLSLEMLKGRRKHEHIFPTTNLTESEDYLFVHKNDIEQLWEAFKLVTSNNGFEASSVKGDLKKKLFSHRSSENDKGVLSERIIQQWRPVSLLCSEHNLVLNPVVLTHTRSQDKESATPVWRYKDNVTLLPTGEYRHYLLVILRLYKLLFSTSTETTVLSNHEDDTDLTVDTMAALLAVSCHPSARAEVKSGNGGDIFTFLTCSIGNATVETRLTPAMCADQRCNHECMESLRTEERLKKPVHHKNGKAERKKALAPAEVVVPVGDDVQIICVGRPAPKESDAEVLRLRLLEVEEGANLEEVISSLSQVYSITEDTGIRRSGRKRKQRYHLGGVKVEELLNVRRDHNVAAVRLHILEKRPNFKLDQPLLLLLPLLVRICETRKKEDSNNITIAIPFDWNKRLISEVVADATESLHLSTEELDKVFGAMVLIRYAPGEALPAKRKAARSREDEAQIEALMESLLQTANLTDKNEPEHETEKKKTNRRVERGFTGTFLHSTLEPTSETERVETADSEVAGNGQDHPNGALNQDATLCVIVESDNEDDAADSEVTGNGQDPQNGAANQDATLCVIVESDNEDNADAVVGGNGSKGSVASKQETPTQDRADISSNSASGESGRHGIVMDELMKVVNLGGGENFDQTKFLEAVTWACESSAPNVEIRDLVDTAYAKFLEVACLN